MAHFDVKGFWVCKCTDGKDVSKLYGIPVTNEMFQARAHAPYNKAFADELTRLIAKYQGRLDSNAIDWVFIARPYDNINIAGNSQEEMIKRTDNLYKYLKVVQGYLGKDLTIINP